MNTQEYTDLRTEQANLKRMLADIPPENVLDRSGLEGRLEEVSEYLKAAGTTSRNPARPPQDNLHEQVTTLHGEFQGVLPNGRRFEFKLTATGEVIRGDIGPTIADPYVLNQHLQQATDITVMATQVGTGKPRYVLLAVPS